ncbi:MAG: hypothetical protein ACFB15_23350 [Cyclobacteriaceae bacterium]
MQELTIYDRTFFGENVGEVQITISGEINTVREIITARVEAEVSSYNRQQVQYFRGLVQPSEGEQTQNGFRLKTRQKIDPEQHTYLALDCFLKNQYFILIDDVQAESLDQEVTLRPKTEISFLKLTPLVGG